MSELRITIGFVFLLFCITKGRSQDVAPGLSAAVQSPDKNYSVNFYQKKNNDGTQGMFYTVTYNGKSVMLESQLDIQMDNQLSEKAMALKVTQTQ